MSPDGDGCTALPLSLSLSRQVDEPSFTQPQMYERIRARKSIPEQYAERLVADGVISEKQLYVPRNLSVLHRVCAHACGGAERQRVCSAP